MIRAVIFDFYGVVYTGTAADPVDRAVVDLVRVLRGTHQVALCSNISAAGLGQQVVAHGLRDLFSVMVTSDVAGSAKPDPGIFTYTLERLGVLPSEALFIDDSPRNVAGAERVGVVGLHYTGVKELRWELESILDVDLGASGVVSGVGR